MAAFAHRQVTSEGGPGCQACDWSSVAVALKASVQEACRRNRPLGDTVNAIWEITCEAAACWAAAVAVGALAAGALTLMRSGELSLGVASSAGLNRSAFKGGRGGSAPCTRPCIADAHIQTTLDKLQASATETLHLSTASCASHRMQRSSAWPQGLTPTVNVCHADVDMPGHPAGAPHLLQAILVRGGPGQGFCEQRGHGGRRGGSCHGRLQLPARRLLHWDAAGAPRAEPPAPPDIVPHLQPELSSQRRLEE